MESRIDVRRISRALRTVSRCSRVLVQAGDELSLLKDVCRVIVEEGGYRLAWVGYARDDERKSVTPVAAFGHDDGYVDQLDITWSDTERGRGPTGTAIRTGTSVILGDMRTDPLYGPWRYQALEHGFGSAIALPLIAGGRPIGSLNIYAAEARAFDGEDVDFLMQLAQNLAYTTVNLRAHAEARKTEDQLRRNEELFRLISDNVEDLIAIIDPEGRRIYNSRSYSKTLGDPESLKDTDSFAEIHPDDREKIRHIFEETVRTGTGSRSEYRFVSKDGRIRFIESQGSVIRDTSGAVSSVLVVSRDVTDRKRAEEERSILQEQFRQAQKLESIGTLAGGIAHDFNNILTIILGYLSLLSKAKLDTSESQKLIQTMIATVERGAALVRQLLTFARKSEVQFAPVRPDAITRELEKVIAETFPKNITLLIQAGEDVPSLVADAGQIHQVLLNLCVNARDAMPDGGVLVISTSKVPHTALLRRFSDVVEGDYVRISVADTGSGMDDSTRGHMFEPFFTTKEQGKGTGLGLAVVYGVVKSHHGFVDVESAPDIGTTFNLYFPAQSSRSSPAEVAPDIHDESPGGSETVLLIEDEEVQRDLVSMLLQDKGYRTLSASNGAEAVDIYRKYKDQIALVVSDFGLPRKTGLEAFLRIKEINPRANFIFASGYLEPDLRENVLKQGAQAFIQKPYEPNQILRTIRNVIDGRLTR
jgi:PAS domain S-box-containing protein